MMPVGFSATDFSAGIENGVLVVALDMSSTDDEDFYLMFQKKQTEYTAQDGKFGWDKPYIEFCGQGWGWYGHMEGVVLERGVITVRMDREAANHMENDGVIQVAFELSDTEFKQLKSSLTQVFDNISYFEIKANK